MLESKRLERKRMQVFGEKLVANFGGIMKTIVTVFYYLLFYVSVNTCKTFVLLGEWAAVSRKYIFMFKKSMVSFSVLLQTYFVIFSVSEYYSLGLWNSSAMHEISSVVHEGSYAKLALWCGKVAHESHSSLPLHEN